MYFKELIKKNSYMYALFKGILLAKEKDYQRLIMSYCNKPHDYDVLLWFKEYGKLNPDKHIYLISHAEHSYTPSGLFAFVRGTLHALDFAEHFHLDPYIYWGYNSYREKEFDVYTKNVFEYYFNPIMDFSIEKVYQSKFVAHSQVNHEGIFEQCGWSADSYMIDDGAVEKLANIYRKYFHLNETTADYIDKGIQNLINKKKVLGVHVRGTDFKRQEKNHPHFQGFEVYVKECKKILKEKNFDCIFLATDDTEALDLFKKEFQGKIVYYEDTLRSSGNVGVHSLNNSNPRKYHHYKLGLEIIRDVYTLAACDGLVSGFSQVSFAARYVKRSMNGIFEYSKVIQYDIN